MCREKLRFVIGRCRKERLKNMSLFQSSHLSSWADRAEVDELLGKDRLSMEEFTKCLYELVMNRCELNLTGDKPVFFFKVNDTYIDIMIRDHMIISISSRPKRDEDCTSDSDFQEHEEHCTENPSDLSPAAISHDGCGHAVGNLTLLDSCPPPTVEHDNVFATLAPEETDQEDVPDSVPMSKLVPAEDVSDSVSMSKLVPAEEEDGWHTVVSKKVRNSSKGAKVSTVESVKDLKHIYFFRDEANSPFTEFVCQVYTVKDMVNLAKKEIWSHGYCMESNTVYDFNDCRRPGSYRCFTPNEAYMHHFSAWFSEYERNNFKSENKDSRRFHVFGEKSTWKEWKYLGVAEGMAQVRKLVKDIIFDIGWAHAYNIEENQLVNFMLDKDTNSLLQKQTEAPEKYLERFDMFLAKQ